MLKILGAFFFGLAAMCGVGYLIIRKQEDQSLRNQVDSAVTKLNERMKVAGGKVLSFFHEIPIADDVIVLEGSDQVA